MANSTTAKSSAAFVPAFVWEPGALQIGGWRVGVTEDQSGALAAFDFSSAETLHRFAQLHDVVVRLRWMLVDNSNINQPNEWAFVEMSRCAGSAYSLRMARNDWRALAQER